MSVGVLEAGGQKVAEMQKLLNSTWNHTNLIPVKFSNPFNLYLSFLCRVWATSISTTGQYSFKINFASIPFTHIYLFMLFDMLPFDVFN